MQKLTIPQVQELCQGKATSSPLIFNKDLTIGEKILTAPNGQQIKCITYFDVENSMNIIKDEYFLL